MNIEKFKSKSGFESYAYFWENVSEPIGVVQILHGMSEHIQRYDFFAEFLNFNGFIVVGMDIRGYGKTAVEGLGLGVVTEGNSFADSVADQIDLAKYIKEKYNLPLCLFGYDFGSFLLQSFIQRASDLIEGVILCGSAKQKGVDITSFETISKVQCSLCGKDKPARFLTRVIFDGFNEKFSYDKVANAWLCSNLESVKKYNKDKMCGTTASIGFFRSFFCGVKDLYEECNLDCIRKELKIFIISGDKDVANGFGVKVTRLYDTYVDSGITDVMMKLYPNKRHDLLNEDIRDQVMFDCLKFFNICLGREASEIKGNVIISDQAEELAKIPVIENVENSSVENNADSSEEIISVEVEVMSAD